MKYKDRMALCMLIAVFLFSSGSVLAFRSSTARVTSRIATGDIDIDILQSDISSDVQDYLYRKIVPGDIISDDVSIRNLAEDCYIRVQVDFECDPEKDDRNSWKHLDYDALEGISERWLPIGEYFYYRDPVSTGEVVPFLKSVSIPASWTEETMDHETGMTITAEAVQAIHFNPDYDSEAPWGDTEIELCVHKNTGEVQKKDKNYQSLTVTVEGAAARLLVFPADFFQNLKTLMPGDTVSDSFSIRNNTEKEAEIFFRTEEPENLTQEQQELLENLEFRMVKDGEEIYCGDLRSIQLQKEISLGSYKKGEASEVSFYISMPEEDQNRYAVRNTMVHWIFCCDSEDEAFTPKTGDIQNIFAYLLMASAAILTIFMAYCHIRKTHLK